jgi:hypothetical protein
MIDAFSPLRRGGAMLAPATFRDGRGVVARSGCEG